MTKPVSWRHSRHKWSRWHRSDAFPKTLYRYCLLGIQDNCYKCRVSFGCEAKTTAEFKTSMDASVKGETR